MASEALTSEEQTLVPPPLVLDPVTPAALAEVDAVEADPCFDYGSLKGCSFLAHTLTPGGQRYALWALRQKSSCPGMLRYVSWLLAKDTWDQHPEIERIVNVPDPPLDGPLTRRIKGWPTWKMVADGSLPAGMRRIFDVHLNFELDRDVRAELDTISPAHMKTLGVFCDYLCRKMIHDLRQEPITERLIVEKALCQRIHWQLYSSLYSATNASAASMGSASGATTSGTSVAWPRSLMPRSLTDVEEVLRRARALALRLGAPHDALVETVARRATEDIEAVRLYRRHTCGWRDCLEAVWQIALLDHYARGGGGRSNPHHPASDTHARTFGHAHEDDPRDTRETLEQMMPACLRDVESAIVGLVMQAAQRFADTSAPVMYAQSLTVGQCLAECDLIHGTKLIDFKVTTQPDLLGHMAQVSGYAS